MENIEGNVYLIKEAAKLVEVEAHVLRYWEEELGLKIKRNEMGHRYYDDTDIKVLKRVKELKERGIQLKAIKQLVKNAEQNGELGPVNGDIEISEEREHNPQRVVEFKYIQFQDMMNKIVSKAIKENADTFAQSLGKETSRETIEGIVEHLEELQRKQDQRDEQRYRKLDSVLRELSQARTEAACTVPTRKKGLFGRKKGYKRYKN